AGFVPCAFAWEALYAWTGDSALAVGAAPLVAMLALGTTLNAWLHLPFQIALANGRSDATAAFALLALALYVPLLVAGVGAHGAIGAAQAWVAVNAMALAATFVLSLPNLPWKDPRTWLLGTHLVAA